MMPPAPTKPSSSPATVNTKSVCCSGTNLPFVWLPWNSPVPTRPPEPIAILAWVTLYAAPWVLASGLVNTRNRSSW